MNDPFEKLKELASQLPPLNSDWDGTNHFELTCRKEEDIKEHGYFWLMVGEGLDQMGDACESELGKKFGLIMDIVAEVSHLKEDGHL